MLSELEIVNNALLLIGEKEIASFTEDSVGARAVSGSFANLRDSLLRECPWNFAIRRVQLAQLVSEGNFEHKNAYQVPSDPYCLRVLEVESGSAWKIQGRTLITDASAVKVAYVARVLETGDWDVLFEEALTLRVAMEMAIMVAHLPGLAEMMRAMYEEAIRIARTVNGQESSMEYLTATELTTVRQI